VERVVKKKWRKKAEIGRRVEDAEIAWQWRRRMVLERGGSGDGGYLGDLGC